MRKKLQVMAVIISGTFMSAALAADKQIPTYGGATAPDPQSSGQIMSNDAFNGTVEKRAAETTNKLSQTVQQQLKSSTPQPPPSTPSSPASSQDQAPQPAQSGDAANMPTKTQPPTTPQAVQPVAAPPTQQSSQPPASSDVYTGFGSGQSNQGNQSNQKSNSSGGSQDGKNKNWNVGY